MKKYISLFIFILCTVAAFSQAGKKPVAKEKPPTKKEMEAMMKDVQKAMDEMDPEDKKMMDSMGFKMPDTKQIKKSVSGISDAQLKKAFEDDNRIVPVKDVVRINSALSVNLTAAQMPAYIDKTHLAVLKKLSAQTKTSGSEILQQLLQSNSEVDNAATGLWIEGKPTLALYLMGEVCKANAADANNLNNYASFLTTCGGEEMALPILNLLNKQYPQNSTLLNNMAQAWLGLGDIPRAEKYADSAIQIYPAHPQANLAKSLIEESKGNIPAAIAAAKKSISEAYSTEKQSRLKKLGYTIKSDDLNWEPPLQKNVMGLDKFTWPKYPFNVEETKSSEMEWSDFKDNCNQLLAELKVKQAIAEKEYERITGLRMQQIIQAVQQAPLCNPYPAMRQKPW